MSKVYFFGDARIHLPPMGCYVHPDDHGPGHFLHRPGNHVSGCVRVHDMTRDVCPWDDRELNILPGDPALQYPDWPGHWPLDGQPERIGRLVHRHGWTALGFWDRTGDDRGNCASVLVADGERSGAAMLALFERTFPAIWKRITKAGPIQLHPGNVDPAPKLRIADEPARLRVTLGDLMPAKIKAPTPAETTVTFPESDAHEEPATAPRRRIVR